MTLPKDPVKRDESLSNYRKAAQKRALDPKWQDGHKKAMQKLHRNPEYQRKHKERLRKLAQDPEWRDGMRKLAQDPEWLENNKKQNRKTAQNPEWIYKNVEGHIGGFWYGNVRYNDSIQYCGLWNEDLFRRIDEAQNYQSILSGKTKFENGGRALDRHHVYWQPKACCEWDEDMQGYYAMINLGTKRKPNWYKHYIKSDPNKFVLLTHAEHTIIRKDKLGYIKIFEDLIETKLGGICYLPKK